MLINNLIDTGISLQLWKQHKVNMFVAHFSNEKKNRFEKVNSWYAIVNVDNYGQFLLRT